MESMVDHRDFWKGKKVLITGHTGFKGSWLSQVLIQFEAELIGFSLEPNVDDNPLYFSLDLSSNIIESFGDIRSEELIHNVISKYKPEIIFHLAAQPLVRESYYNPVLTFETNVMGTVNLLEAVRKNTCVKSCVCITTDKVYKNKEWHWGYRENDTLGGHDPYSNSKACCELVIESYRNSFFLNNSDQLIASVRAGNVIGGGDFSKDRLLPDIMNSIFLNKKLEIRSPKAIRPWQHVLDPLNGYLILANKLFSGESKYCDAWNFGPNPEGFAQVDEMIKLINNIHFEDIDIDLVDADLHETSTLKLDISKAKQELSWDPNWDLKNTIEKVYEWYSDYFKSPSNAKTTTINQINNFFNIK